METLPYADPDLRIKRRRTRWAWAGLLLALLSPILSGSLLLAANANALPQHFLCCNHPEVAQMTFIGVPLLGGLAALAGVARVVLDRTRFTGVVLSTIALLVNGVLVSLGVLVVAALKM